MKTTVYLVSGIVRPRVLEAFTDAAWQLDLRPGLVISRADAEALTQEIDAQFDSIVVVPDIQSADEIADGVRAAIEDVTSAVIVSWYDSTMLVAARAAEILGSNRTPAAGMARARNKLAMRRALEAAGCPSPRYSLMSAASQAAEVAAEVGLPAIVKPVNGTGSALITRVESVQELREAYERSVRAAPRAVSGLLVPPVHDPEGRPVDATSEFLVESVLRGPEYDAEIVVVDGVVHTTLLMQVVTDPATHYIFGMVSPPVDLPPERVPLVLDAIQRAVVALGLDNTTANASVIDDVDAGPTLVEMNAGRFGGSMIGRLVWDLTGVDVRIQNLALATGGTLPHVHAKDVADGAVAALTVFAEQPGTVVEINGLDELRAHPKVTRVMPHVAPGDEIAPFHATYAVNAVVRGFTTIAELRELQREFSDLVRVVTVPAPDVAERNTR